MANSETVRINGKLYRKFIRFPDEVTDGTLRCIIDEEEHHDHEICVAALQPTSELAPALEPSLLPCPFCGSPEVDPRGWTGNDGSHGPACDVCCGSAQTVDLWNSRPLVPLPEDVGEAAYCEADAFSDWFGCDSEKRARLTQAFEHAILAERIRHETQLSACKAAVDAYNTALQRREHGGMAASQCVEAVERVFYPEKFQPAGAVRQAKQEN